MYFLLQAEDGIRDYKVTGVQTCALPILLWQVITPALVAATSTVFWPVLGTSHPELVAGEPVQPAIVLAGPPRSEERRVGKEGKTGRTRANLNKRKTTRRARRR